MKIGDIDISGHVQVDDTLFGTPNPKQKALKDRPSGMRVCFGYRADGTPCTTRLNIYNESNYCHACRHEGRAV